MRDRSRTMAMSWIPDLADLARRFPVPVAALVVFGVHYFIWPEQPIWLSVDHRSWLRAGEIASLTFVLGLALELLGEARSRSARWKLAAGIAAALAAIAIALAQDWLDYRSYLMVYGLLLCIGVAAYLPSRKPDNDAFWLFNHTLWAGLAVALLVSVLFGAGVSAIFGTLNYLFGIHIGNAAFTRVWLLALGFVAPLYWLTLIPKRFDDTIAEGSAANFGSRAVAVLVKFVLVPLLLIYAVILHVYAIKIGVVWELPKGQIGWMVSWFGVAVALTGLLAYPTREKGGALLRLFWKIWPWLLVVPVGLLGVGVIRRIGDYGLTEPRYMLLLFGGWLVSLVITQGLMRQRDLRLVPGLLGAALVLASIGPWGSFGLPIRLQKASLVRGLEAAGVTKNGRVVLVPGQTAAIPPQERYRLAQAVRYLAKANRVGELAPIFKGVADDPLAQPVEDRWDWSTQFGNRVVERLGLTITDDEASTFKRDGRTIARGVTPSTINDYYNADHPLTIPFDGARALVGNFRIDNSKSDAPGRQGPVRKFDINSEPHEISFVLGRVVVRNMATGKTAEFDIAKDVTVRARLTAHRDNSTATPKSAIKVWPVVGDLPMALIVDQIDRRVPAKSGKPASLDDLNVLDRNIESISFWIALGVIRPAP